VTVGFAMTEGAVGGALRCSSSVLTLFEQLFLQDRELYLEGVDRRGGGVFGAPAAIMNTVSAGMVAETRCLSVILLPCRPSISADLYVINFIKDSRETSCLSRENQKQALLLKYLFGILHLP
jgi:hypothetical protein